MRMLEVQTRKDDSSFEGVSVARRVNLERVTYTASHIWR